MFVGYNLLIVSPLGLSSSKDLSVLAIVAVFIVESYNCKKLSPDSDDTITGLTRDITAASRITRAPDPRRL